MYLLIAYDVSTATPAGARRLRRVAKTCENYGQRVQKSVFECQVDAARYVEFKARLLSLIDTQHDSIRLYNLGNNWKPRVEHIGKNDAFDIDGLLLVE